MSTFSTPQIVTRLVKERRIKGVLHSIQVTCAPPHQETVITLDASEFSLIGMGQDLSPEAGGIRFVYLFICDKRMDDFLRTSHVYHPNVESESTISALTKDIADWADEYIPDRKPMDTLTKLVMEEIPELLVSDFDEMEIADAGILMFDLCYLLGVDLTEVMERKMRINRERNWTVNEKTGLLKHV